MTDDRVSRQIKSAYEENVVYRRETICLKPDTGSDYADFLLSVKLDMVRQNDCGDRLVDLCCGSGEHVFALRHLARECIGIDFSENFIAHANADSRTGEDVRFVVGDAKAIPLESNSVDVLFSFSALYAIPGVEDVFAEIARVLRPGGRCVLDLGNSRSLNQVVARSYPEIPPTFMIKPGQMRSGLEGAGLKIIQRRYFQILPLWADKPRWLAPLLHPVWKNIMKTQIRGKLLDEWVSSLPIFRHFAFRHLIVCEKPLSETPSEAIKVFQKSEPLMHSCKSCGEDLTVFVTSHDRCEGRHA